MFDPNNIDQKADNLTRAIGLAEGGGKFDYSNTSGDAGTSRGAYQWQPGNFESMATKYGFDPTDFSPKNQNRVAYSHVKSQLDQGYKPWEIAAEWNSGNKKNYEDHKGSTTINGKNIEYDTPGYVNNVKNYYNKLSGGIGETPTEIPNPAADIANPTPEVSPQPTEKPGIVSQSLSQFGKGYGQIKEGVESGSPSGLLDIGKGVLNEAAGGIRLAFSPIEWATKMVAKIPGVSDIVGKTEEGINYVADKISNNKTLQDFVMNNPDAEEVAGNLITIGGALVGGKKSAEIREGLAPITDVVKDTVVKPVRTALENKYIKNTVDDWERIGGDYVKTDKLLNLEEKTGKDTPTFLAQMGINPKELIGEGKFIKAGEVADKLTKESVRPFEDILTQQLKVAQQGQPLVNVGELHSRVIGKINAIKGITEGDRATMVAAATREMRLLYNKYPKGIPLDVLNEIKGTYWRNTKFDMMKPLQPQVNYNIGSTIKDVIEQKVPDANIQDLNSLLGDYYSAGKFLRGIQDRVPKLTARQKVGRGIVKAAATLGGESLFGIKGGIAGFLLGKSISHLLENASNPLKEWILANLDKTNPKVYEQAIKWLGEQERARNARLMLPSAGESLAPEGKQGKPIPRVINVKGESKTTYEAPSQNIHQEIPPEPLQLNSPGQNPIQLPGPTNP